MAQILRGVNVQSTYRKRGARHRQAPNISQEEVCAKLLELLEYLVLLGGSYDFRSRRSFSHVRVMNSSAGKPSKKGTNAICVDAAAEELQLPTCS
ncbi:hypothetical protein MRX96_030696 [Rhipicephalus microplus]